MYKLPVTVEFEDVDSYQIAHHTKIIAYLERARVHFIIDRGININEIGFGPVLVNLNMKFKQPLFMLDEVEVELQTKNIDKFRFEWDYVITKNGKKAIIATIQQAFINLESKRLIPIPDELRSILKTIEIRPPGKS